MPDATSAYDRGALITVCESFESVELQLREGSVLAFYTDSLVETRDQDVDIGMHRLSTVLAQPGLPLEVLCSAVVDTRRRPYPGTCPRGL